jgi:hypothetical protein
VVENQPSKCEALSLNPRTTKGRRKEGKKEREKEKERKELTISGKS